MKRLFLLLALCGMVAVGCTEGGPDDNINNGGNNTEQPEEKPDDGSEIPDDAYITLNKEVLTFVPDGESVEVKVYSNYEWTLTNNCDWVTTSISGGDASEEGAAITLTADLTYDNREGTIIFSCGKAKKLLVVSQSFKEAIIADENNVFNVPAEGGNVIINYQTTVECEVIIPEEAKSWISLAPATRALVSESATLTVAENTTYSERSAVVKVVKVGDNTLFAEYTINQVQNDAIIADENNTFNLKGWAQSINLAYQTNVECEVVIPEEAKSWISLASATRALVNESATLNIADNNTGAERSAVVKVVAANNNELVAEYTITQAQRYYIEYTSEGGDTVRPYDSSAFDATIIRNEYIDGKGYIDFDAPITSIGEGAFYYCTSLTSVTIPDGVTSIGSFAFASCESLTSVTIGKGVTSIGDVAFNNCTSLTSVYITDIAAWCKISFGDFESNPLYDAGNLYLNNELVTDLIIPDSVTSIGSYVFGNCTSLTSVTIPDSVTSIGYEAFYNCDSLTSVTIGNGVTSIGENPFCGCSSLQEFNGDFASEDGRCLIIDGELNSFASAGLTEYTIPDSVTTIGKFAFYDCDSLTSITIPDSVTTIGYYAFYGCTSLESVTIGSGVTTIGSYAFYYCTGELIVNCNIPSATYYYDGAFYGAYITKVTIGDSVTTIGNCAFNNCTSLTSVTIGNGVTSIGGSAFSGCTSLTSITIPDSVTKIGRSAFYGCTGELIVNCNIPSATEFSDGAFYDAYFTKVTIGDGVTSIGDYAFYGCNSLTSVTIPDSVTSIGYEAFMYCTSLTSITIPDSVTTIRDSAFQDCTSLKEVYCKPTTPPYLYTDRGGTTFARNAFGRKIYVPRASVDAYKYDVIWNWNQYADAIVGYDF